MTPGAAAWDNAAAPGPGSGSGLGPAPVVAAEPDGPSFALILSIGVVSFLFGLVVLLWPDLTVRVYAVLVGLWLLIAGASRIVDTFRPGRPVGRRLLSGIVGIVLFFAGAACLRDVAKGVVVLALVVAVAWLLGAVAWWVLASQAAGSTRTWLIVLAAVSAVLGLVFLLYPDVSLTVLVWLTGLGSLALGAGEIAFAFAARRRAS
jgi:uncharacterized membrane protein HdeD (DUF308 family)